jgi:hypothetical protein
MRTIELSVSVQVDEGLSEEDLVELSNELQRRMWQRLSDADINGVRIRTSDISMMGWIAPTKPAISR